MKALRRAAFALLVSALFAPMVAHADIERRDKEWLLERLDDPKVLVVDTRAEAQWSKGRIRGALHIDGEFTANIATYDRQVTVVFYCA